MFVKVERTNSFRMWECDSLLVRREGGSKIMLDMECHAPIAFPCEVVDVAEEKDVEGIYIMGGDGKTIEAVYRR
ncbi:MAG: hypothetical protein ABFE07_06545 [Armatimonadia bacterium]